MKKVMILGVTGSLLLAAGVVWLIVLRGGGGGEAVVPVPFTPITETGIQQPIHREVIDPNDPSDVLCYAAAAVYIENGKVKEVASSGTKVSIPPGTAITGLSYEPIPDMALPVHYDEEGQLAAGWERCEPYYPGGSAPLPALP